MPIDAHVWKGEWQNKCTKNILQPSNFAYVSIQLIDFSIKLYMSANARFTRSQFYGFTRTMWHFSLKIFEASSVVILYYYLKLICTTADYFLVINAPHTQVMQKLLIDSHEYLWRGATWPGE